MFDDENRLRCLATTGIDPNAAYDHFMLDVKVGGPASARLLLNLGRRMDDERVTSLSPRKREVMVLFAQGYTRQQIADELGIGIETVKTYLEQVRHRLDARNGTHAVALCIVLGLLDNPDEGEPSCSTNRCPRSRSSAADRRHRCWRDERQGPQAHWPRLHLEVDGRDPLDRGHEHVPEGRGATCRPRPRSDPRPRWPARRERHRPRRTGRPARRARRPWPARRSRPSRQVHVTQNEDGSVTFTGSDGSTATLKAPTCNCCRSTLET